MSFVVGLTCHECGAKYPLAASYVCSDCMGPLVRATRLAKELGLSELYIKDDSVNHPTFSYKDRVVSVAASKAVEFNFPVFSCASTGNLAGSVAAHAARLGLPCYVFIPHDLEPAKILGAAIYRPHVVAVEGNYDDVNRLCTQIAEQLGWRYPDHIVSPVAGGTLLPRIYKGLRELREIGLVQGELPHIHAAQPAGSSPVVNALEAGLDFPEPVKPNTIAKSLAIGNPADGFQVVQVVKETGGTGAMVSDEEILDAIQLLASTEGIFTEPAGGTTLAATRALVQRGAIKSTDS